MLALVALWGVASLAPLGTDLGEVAGGADGQDDSDALHGRASRCVGWLGLHYIHPDLTADSIGCSRGGYLDQGFLLQDHRSNAIFMIDLVNQSAID